MRCCRKKFTFAISSPDEFLYLVDSLFPTAALPVNHLRSHKYVHSVFYYELFMLQITDRSQTPCFHVTGVQGLPGGVGSAGFPGPTGPTGATGLRGDTGATGVPGGPGVQGLVGNPGSAGPTGYSGAFGVLPATYSS